jgi:hypothetical protein
MNSHADGRALDDAAWNQCRLNADWPIQIRVCFDHKSIVAEQLFAHNRKSKYGQRTRRTERDLFLCSFAFSGG